MKLGKFSVLLSLILWIVLTTFCMPVSAEASGITLDRVVQINDYQLILEFSEPVTFNYYGVSSGPYWAIRITDESFALKKSGNTNLQWPGILTYADSYHDRLLFTMTSTRLGIDSITEIMNFEGELSSFKGSLVTFCFEEVSGPSSQGKDSLVGNVSDAFGLTFLVANRVASSDGCYVKIEKDFSYKIDLSEAEGIPNARVDADVYIETPATTVLPTDTAEVTTPQTTQAVTTDAPSEPTTEPIVKEPVGQTNMVVYLVCILLSVGSIVVIVLNRKGKGQSK